MAFVWPCFVQHVHIQNSCVFTGRGALSAEEQFSTNTNAYFVPPYVTLHMNSVILGLANNIKQTLDLHQHLPSPPCPISHNVAVA